MLTPQYAQSTMTRPKALAAPAPSTPHTCSESQNAPTLEAALQSGMLEESPTRKRRRRAWPQKRCAKAPLAERSTLSEEAEPIWPRACRMEPTSQQRRRAKQKKPALEGGRGTPRSSRNLRCTWHPTADVSRSMEETAQQMDEPEAPPAGGTPLPICAPLPPPKAAEAVGGAATRWTPAGLPRMIW